MKNLPKHKWEKRGFVAPYNYVGLFIQNNLCDVCGAQILFNFEVEDANGKRFIVGSDCIYNLNDVGLTKIVKAKKKELNKQIRQEKKQAIIAQTRQAKIEKIEQTKKENFEKFTQEHPDSLEALNYALSDDTAPAFARSIANTIIAYYNVSEKQLNALNTVFQNKLDSDLPKSDCVEGKITITGKVLTVKTYESNFGYHNYITKMLVLDDRGFKVFGTVPATLYNENPLQGQRVSFVATVEPSNDDKGFGYYSRPSKAHFVN